MDPTTKTLPLGRSVAVLLWRTPEGLAVGDHTPVTFVSGVIAVTDPTTAEIVVEPSARPVARPVVDSTVATDCVPDDHDTMFVTSAVEASE
jgi:hypothetical protein